MLRGSLKLGSLFGIPIFVHWTFLLLLAWFMAGPLFSGAADAIGASLRTGAFVLAIFGCVVLHELGHALAARRFGVATRDITLLPIGGVARLERMPERPAQELIVALAGPVVNVVIAAILIPLALSIDGVGAFGIGGTQAAASGAHDAAAAATGAYDAADAIVPHRRNFLAALATVNVFLVIFNMIPALPMDGGRVLRSLLAMMMDRSRATRTAAALGQLVAVGFAILGVLSGNILLIVIAAFVFLGAGGEVQAEQVRSALAGLAVRAAMMTRFRCVRASQSLREAANELLAGSQQDFPVLKDGAEEDDASALVGVLTRGALLRALAAGKMESPVSSAMVPMGPPVGEDEDLRTAMERARSRGTKAASDDEVEGASVVAVVRDDPSRPGRPRLVGIVTPENLTELVMLRHAVTGVPQR